MKAKRELTRNQKLFGLLLKSQTKFLRYFWHDELTLPPSTRQKVFWNDTSERIELATGRKTGKTVYLEGRVIRKAILYAVYHPERTTSERMFVTPGDNQMVPFIERLTSKVNQIPLFRFLKEGWNKNEGLLRFHTGVNWYFRIDGSAGTDANMIGLRAQEILGDEMQLTIDVTHKSRMQSALPLCEWCYCGVPNGIRHTPFWKIDQTQTGRLWSRFKFSTFVNPLYWGPKGKQQLLDDYGEGSQDYITQVMGGWGEEVFSSFPPGSIAIDERMPYRVVKFTAAEIPYEYDAATMARMAARFLIPHVDAAQYALGMDFGHLQDPTEIGVAYRKTKNDDDNLWKMLLRVHVEGANHLAQARLLRFLMWALGQKKVAAFCLDQMGEGGSVATDLIESDEGMWWSHTLYDFNAGGIVLVDIAGEAREKLEEEGGKLKQEVKKVRRKQYYTEQLQAALLAARADLTMAKVRLFLANDPDMIQELIDTREKKTASGQTVYLPRMLHANRPVDHITDMLRTLIVAILEAMRAEDEEEVGEEESVGWAENPFSSGDSWRAPWEARVGRKSMVG